MSKEKTTKLNPETSNAAQPEPSNPFSFEQSTTASTESRRLDYTPALIDLSNRRATDLMMNLGKQPELFDLANKAIDGGNPSDLIDLLKAVYNDETIHADAQVLDGCDENQLSRLLESRRSDRSKSKKKNPRSSAVVCRTYIASMYAELLIREYWNKPYTGSSSAETFDLDSIKDDVDAIGRKVRSLQSKKSRLSKIAVYDSNAKNELQKVEAEIARLNSLRPNTRTKTTTIIKDESVDQLRAVLSAINPETLSEQEREAYAKLIAKIG